MSEALNAEAVLASIVELRNSLAEARAELKKNTNEVGKLTRILDFPKGRSAKAW